MLCKCNVSCFSIFFKTSLDNFCTIPTDSQAREYIQMLIYPILLLCKLCSFNASISVESRNNILLSQLLFFHFLVFFSFCSLFPPPLLWSKQCAIQHGISWRQSSTVAHCKFSMCCIVHEKVVHSKPGSHLLPLEMLFCFCLGREAGALLDLLREIAICTVCTAHASESP